MKKKFLALGMVIVLAFTMLTGCGSNTDKKDYMNDIEEFAELSEMDLNTDDIEEIVDTMKSTVKKLDVTTPEGKALKKDLEKLVDLTSDLAEYMNVEDYADIDFEKLTKLQEDIEKLSDTAEDDLEAFLEAAEDAGVDEDDLEDLDLGF